jgi:rhodanese-related sulfurtransferase
LESTHDSTAYPIRTADPESTAANTTLCVSNTPVHMSSIRPAELDDRLRSTSGAAPFLLDIRPESAFDSGAIDGSHNVPVYDELRRGDESALREQLATVPTDRSVVVVCKMGVVARRATSVLRDEGYDASTLLGGMRGWRGYQNGSLSYKLRSLVWRFR